MRPGSQIDSGAGRSAPVDYSARIQTVHADTNRRNDALLRRFNFRGEPIVCTPEGLVQDYRSTLIED